MKRLHTGSNRGPKHKPPRSTYQAGKQVLVDEAVWERGPESRLRGDEYLVPGDLSIKDGLRYGWWLDRNGDDRWGVGPNLPAPLDAVEELQLVGSGLVIATESTKMLDNQAQSA